MPRTLLRSAHITLHPRADVLVIVNHTLCDHVADYPAHATTFVHSDGRIIAIVTYARDTKHACNRATATLTEIARRLPHTIKHPRDYTITDTSRVDWEPTTCTLHTVTPSRPTPATEPTSTSGPTTKTPPGTP